jgi:predicted RNA-binding Zn-ribbon protein involved in translation (DUF1610 family)
MSLRTRARKWTEPWSPGVRAEPLGEIDEKECPACGETVFWSAVACPRCGHRYVSRLASRILGALTSFALFAVVPGGIAYLLFHGGYGAVTDRTVSRSGTGQAISDVVDYLLMVGSASFALGMLLIGVGTAVEIGRRPEMEEPYDRRLDTQELGFRIGGPFASLGAVCAFGLLGCGVAALILTGT